MGLWLDPVTVGNSLKVIVPWAIKALGKLPDFACPATVKAQLMFWLNWADALSTNPTALAGACAAINAATQATPPIPTP